MSTKPTVHKATKTMSKHNVPIVNVFDEDQATPSVQPARRPVVVEIEDVQSNLTSPTPPPTPVTQPVVPMVAPSVPPTPVAPPVPEPSNQSMWQTQPVAAPAPVVPPTPVAPPVTSQGMSSEPTLPSFFAHDLKMDTTSPVTPTAPAAPTTLPNTNMFADMSTAMPQAVVGEVSQAAQGGSRKKMIGIILMIAAVLILAVGGLFLYARNLFAPSSLPTPTPEVLATAKPTPVLSPSPVATASATPTASESALLKKKVKVDVLNGTKIAGLATKQANLLKAAGFTTGTVGNGDADDAGTIVYPPMYKGLIAEIKSTLKDMTFTASESAKATTIVVTLGDK